MSGAQNCCCIEWGLCVCIRFQLGMLYSGNAALIHAYVVSSSLLDMTGGTLRPGAALRPCAQGFPSASRGDLSASERSAAVRIGSNHTIPQSTSVSDTLLTPVVFAIRRGFQRVALQPGEAVRVRFALRGADFAEVVHPAGLAAAAAAEWAVEVGPIGRALAAGVAAPWADGWWTPHADESAVVA